MIRRFIRADLADVLEIVGGACRIVATFIIIARTRVRLAVAALRLCCALAAWGGRTS